MNTQDTNKVTVRKPQTWPYLHQIDQETVSGQGDMVRFNHPYYPSGRNTLIRLLAQDGSRDGQHFGIHHETARLACAIIAANRFDGYLSTEADGLPISEHQDDILFQKEYFFQVPKQVNSQSEIHPADRSPHQYPIVPNFSQWAFPHDNVPASWFWTSHDAPKINPSARTADSQSGLKARDGQCRVSDAYLDTQNAHIIPQSSSKKDWFEKNLMHKYCNEVWRVGVESHIHDMNNQMLLRSDLHHMYDNDLFMLVTKNKKLVTHVLVSIDELRQPYHNCEVLPTGISPHFAFARFAITIFARLPNFLNYKDTQRLVDMLSGTVTDVDRNDMASFLPPTSSAHTSGKSSPKKRKSQSGSESPEKQQRTGSPTKRHRRLSRPRTLSTSLSDQESDDLNDGVVEGRRLYQLWKDAIAKERARSDPNGTRLKCYDQDIDDEGSHDIAEDLVAEVEL